MNIKKQFRKPRVLIGNSIITFLFILLISCNNNSEEKKGINPKQVSHKGSIEFEFDFPDTIKINKVYHGKIIYNGIFDTITTSFKDKQNSRYITFYMTKTKIKIKNIEEFAKIKLDTFGAIDNRTIPFYDIKFTQAGTYYIDGIINDHVIIDTSVNPKPNNKVRYLEKVVQATHKVVVVR